MEAQKHQPQWKTLLAFAIIYLVWGSTYLAIRVGVREVPPFLFAAVRFLTAGLLLGGWAIARGERLPDRRQWKSLFLLALLIFVMDYGLLFRAEQRVPSGVAAVMMATIPGFMALFDVLLLRTHKPTIRLVLALLAGFAGVAILANPGLQLGGAAVDRAGAIALLIASLSWSLASALTRKLPLPESKVVTSAAQMIAGGLLLAVVSTALGEFHHFHPRATSAGVWLALLYLIFAGSILGFTTYVWLIHRESPTRVGTYAYVNPVVAVLLGYLFGGEKLDARVILGSALVLIGVIVITTGRMPQRLDVSTSPETV